MLFSSIKFLLSAELCRWLKLRSCRCVVQKVSRLLRARAKRSCLDMLIMVWTRITTSFLVLLNIILNKSQSARGALRTLIPSKLSCDDFLLLCILLPKVCNVSRIKEYLATITFIEFCILRIVIYRFIALLRLCANFNGMVSCIYILLTTTIEQFC